MVWKEVIMVMIKEGILSIIRVVVVVNNLDLRIIQILLEMKLINIVLQHIRIYRSNFMLTLVEVIQNIIMEEHYVDYLEDVKCVKMRKILILVMIVMMVGYRQMILSIQAFLGINNLLIKDILACIVRLIWNLFVILLIKENLCQVSLRRVKLIRRMIITTVEFVIM